MKRLGGIPLFLIGTLLGLPPARSAAQQADISADRLK
jgi:hypothetical protein